MSHPQTRPEDATVNAADTLRVSVVIPCYNQAQFLPEAVASVVAQTFTDWEIIIIDDGSPDDTAAVAQRLIAAHRDRCIRLIRQENRGLAEARNAGIRVARAPYILPLDADDMIEPEMLAQTVAALDAHPEVGFVYTDVRRFGAENNVMRTLPYSLERLRFENLMMPATLFRREAWEQVGGFRTFRPVQGYEDREFWVSLADAGWKGLAHFTAAAALSAHRKGVCFHRRAATTLSCARGFSSVTRVSTNRTCSPGRGESRHQSGASMGNCGRRGAGCWRIWGMWR
jgi:Glycosyltransferases involved in cell wall biogenesis